MRKEEEELKNDIAKGLQSISLLTTQHMSQKGLVSSETKKSSSDRVRTTEKMTLVHESEEKGSTNDAEDSKLTLSRVEDGEGKPVNTVGEHTEVGEGKSVNTAEERTDFAGDVQTNQEDKIYDEVAATSYTSLGETFRNLTAKMKDAVLDIKENNLPFIDDDEEDEEPDGCEGRRITLQHRSDDNDEEETLLDQAILEASGLSNEIKVEKLEVGEQVEASPEDDEYDIRTASATLV